MEKYTQQAFIEKAKEVHGDKYDYSKVEYVNCNTKVCIICPKHGEFYIKPGNFLHGQGCKWCGIEKHKKERALTTEEFINRAKEVHGNKYDYSKVEYVNCDTKVCIICSKHGEFWQTPYKHVNNKCGCPKCAKNIPYTTEEFVKSAIAVHGDKYDYSKSQYIDAFTKVCITCPKHGDFWQTPCTHLAGRGCPKCAGKNKTTEEFINEVKKIHGDKYDYSNVVYNGALNPIRLICPKHGEFISTPHALLSGQGCLKCGIEHGHEKQRLSTEEFVRKAKSVHGDKYDYSKTIYVNARTPVIVTCKKHGDFSVIPNSHTSSSKTGCPKCSESTLEMEVRVFCENNNIEYVAQKKFKWLGEMKIDVFLPEYKIAIECQGYYHFEPYHTLNNQTAEENLLRQIKRDEEKNRLLKEHGIKLLYYIPTNLIPKTKISKIYKNTSIVNKVDELLNYIS